MFRTFYHIKSVNSGLIRLLEKFCSQHDLKLPFQTQIFAFNDRVPFSEWVAMLNYIEHHYPSSALGLEIAELVESEHLGILGYICCSSDNLGSALQYLLKYHRLSYDFMELSIKLNEKELIISWDFDEHFKAGKNADETIIAVFISFIKKLIFPEKLLINRIDFVTDKSKDSKVYLNFFECPVYFNQCKTSLYFPLSNLSLKTRNADKTLNYFLSQQAETLLNDLPQNNSFGDVVKHEIVHSINQGEISIESVATRLDYTPRMFQYQLKQEGLNFKQLLNQVRKDLAIKYLSDLSLTILEISYLLSYQEQTSFIRAFKTWTGLSPLQYRRQFIVKFGEDLESEWDIVS